MLESKKCYRIGEYYPNTHIPYGKVNDNLYKWQEKDDLLYDIISEISYIDGSLNKYDYPFEDQKKMCDGLKEFKAVLIKAENELRGNENEQ